ncbi:LIM/homeobox protein Lhx2-like [Amphibalanus amphitrite]|uniref:LIM/homeobox protein Lhx2-like n=1 Tax=Amphibalanus amphitrite TaxID=1232801 RepID=UPI001C919E96|nr:LIM/homeobox protein Lhx2-like [Amphibalanus amphitrite]
MRDGYIYCRHHYELLLTGEYAGAGPVPDFVQFSPTEQIPYIPPVAVGQKGRPRKRKSQHEDMSSLGMGPGLHEYPSDLDHMGYESPGPHSQRSKRMRTSFKHHQLRTMKSYFALNQNPDAKDLKQLAQKTGLSKRVLQVWFQNARAKWRRTVLRQEKSGESKDGLQSLHGDTGSGPGSAGGPGPGAGPGTTLDAATVGSAMGYGDMYA